MLWRPVALLPPKSLTKLHFGIFHLSRSKQIYFRFGEIFKNFSFIFSVQIERIDLRPNYNTHFAHLQNQFFAPMDDEQCDLIGRFIALWTTFQSLWQQ